jgi:hypothetical protein
VTRRLGLLASTLATCGLALLVALPAAATDTPLNAGDDRATAHADNAVDCEDAGLAGEIITVEYQISDTGTHITITSLPEGMELTGIVVKGGPAYNVYPPSALDGLHAPISGGGQIPEVSHWYACGAEAGTVPTTTSAGSTTTSGSDSVAGSEDPSSDTAPDSVSGDDDGEGGGGSAPGEVDDASLAATGFSGSGLLIAGGGLLLIGLALVFGVRASRRQTQD